MVVCWVCAQGRSYAPADLFWPFVVALTQLRQLRLFRIFLVLLANRRVHETALNSRLRHGQRVCECAKTWRFAPDCIFRHEKDCTSLFEISCWGVDWIKTYFRSPWANSDKVYGSRFQYAGETCNGPKPHRQSPTAFHCGLCTPSFHRRLSRFQFGASRRIGPAAGRCVWCVVKGDTTVTRFVLRRCRRRKTTTNGKPSRTQSDGRRPCLTVLRHVASTLAYAQRWRWNTVRQLVVPGTWQNRCCWLGVLRHRPAWREPQAPGAVHSARPPGATPRRTPAASTLPGEPRESCTKILRAGSRGRWTRSLLPPLPPWRRPPRQAGVRERGRRCRGCAFLSTSLFVFVRRRRRRGGGRRRGRRRVQSG